LGKSEFERPEKKIPSKEELIHYFHTRVEKQGYEPVLTKTLLLSSIDVQKRRIVINPDYALMILKQLVPYLQEQGLTWRNFIDKTLEHEKEHEKLKGVLQKAGYEYWNFEGGAVAAEDYLVELRIYPKWKKIIEKYARFVLLPWTKESYEAVKAPLDMRFVYCAEYAQYILLGKITLDELKPYLSQKSIQFIEEWKKILKKIRDEKTLIKALVDVRWLWLRWQGIPVST